MSKNLTWLKPSGEWGIEGVDLAALPPAAYGALAKLMRLEHPICGPNPPLTLDELQAMDGEPVWNDTVKQWMLIDMQWECGPRAVRAGDKWRDLGDRYYRRKPEEGTT